MLFGYPLCSQGAAPNLSISRRCMERARGHRDREAGEAHATRVSGEGQEPPAGFELTDSRRKLAKASQRGDRERFLWVTR